MKFLIDVQLPLLFKKWFLGKGAEEVMHVSELEGGLRMSDGKVWEAAKEKGQIIVTKDIDFFDMSITRGSPPKVLLIRYGNCSNAEMIQYLSSGWKELESRLDKTDTRLITMTKETMEIHHD